MYFKTIEANDYNYRRDPLIANHSLLKEAKPNILSSMLSSRTNVVSSMIICFHLSTNGYAIQLLMRVGNILQCNAVSS